MTDVYQTVALQDMEGVPVRRTSALSSSAPLTVVEHTQTVAAH